MIVYDGRVCHDCNGVSVCHDCNDVSRSLLVMIVLHDCMRAVDDPKSPVT